MGEKLYTIRSEFYRLNRGVPMAVYQPAEKSERSKIAVLAMHSDADYLSFEPAIELAKRGFLTAGANPESRSVKGKLLDIQAALVFLKQYPGVEKVVLLGHSNGGCICSCYQYVAENGVSRFQKKERLVPFPDVEPLEPADGLMLFDTNYGIMEVLPLDPAVKSRENGFERDPELDIYNPANGYDPEGSHYSMEFARKFQRAQIRYYKELLSYAQERMALIRAGKGRFLDDEPVLVPGGSGGSRSNKLFLQDNRYLGHTRMPGKLLHDGGQVTVEVVYTVRPTNDAPRSETYRACVRTSVKELMENEILFDDDFGYDECSMWGADWDFNPYASRANVQGISVPLLVEGNTASHEFIQAEYNYELAKSADKDLFFLEGATHMFHPVKPEYGDTLKTLSDYTAAWLAKPGRFLD